MVNFFLEHHFYELCCITRHSPTSSVMSSLSSVLIFILVIVWSRPLEYFYTVYNPKYAYLLPSSNSLCYSIKHFPEVLDNLVFECSRENIHFGQISQRKKFHVLFILRSFGVLQPRPRLTIVKLRGKQKNLQDFGFHLGFS